MSQNKNLDVVMAVTIVGLLFCVLFPFLTGSLKLMIVLSGSMTPVMLPGDMIVVQKVNPVDLVVGDTIAFQQPGGKPNTVFTHRIIDVRNSNNLTFQTKGDANNVQDDFRTPAENVKGKLVFVIPYLGWLPEVAKNKWVFVCTIVVPVLILIFDEIRNMMIYSNPSKARKHERDQKKIKARTAKSVSFAWLSIAIAPIFVIMTILMVMNTGIIGSTIIDKDMTVENHGSMPMVYVITTDDPTQQMSVQPWYGVIEARNTTRVQSSVSASAQVSTAPYILPVDWIIILAHIDPYLPNVAIYFGYIITVMLFSMPLWYRKSVRGNYARQRKQKSLFTQVRRKLKAIL